MRGSLVGWNKPETDFIEGLIGFEHEEMEPNSKPVHTMEAIENEDTVDQSSASVLSMKQGGGVKPLGKNRSVTFSQLLLGAITVLAVSNSFKSQVLFCSCKIS